MDNKNKVSLISLGCAKNLVDSEILKGGFLQEKVELTENPEEANTIIINTCGFLDQAREESVNVILEAAEFKKSGVADKLVVMGCLSERYPDELRKDLPEVDEIFGTNDHRQIISFITGKPYVKDDPMYYRSLMTPGHYAYIKIAEGCDNGCSFCSIPLMRGLQKSRPIKNIVAEAERLVENGVKELLVIAQDSTSYGWDLEHKVYLSDLIKELDKLPDPLKWLRIHYAHPAHLSNRIIEAMAASSKVCSYLDMPIQHASDKLLTSMKRGLGLDGIRKRIHSLRSAIPDIALRTTLIVGYPDETEDDFRILCDFLHETKFDRLGVFTYSEEENTSAANLKDNVPREVKDERLATIQTIQNQISAEKNSKLEGKLMDVLIDYKNERGCVGRTEKDSPDVDQIVLVNGDAEVGDFVKVRITDSTEFELMGTIEP